MKCMIGFLLLAFAIPALAQQQPSTSPPPYTTPPTFPQSQVPPQQLPPDTSAPPPKTLATNRVQQEIQDKLNHEPTLANENITVRTDDKRLVLKGTVHTEGQHDLALHIVQSYAGDRKIVDNITIAKGT